MNRIFKVVFSYAKRMFVVANEHAKKQGKTNNLKAVVGSIVLGLLSLSLNAYAAGSVSVGGTSNMTVTSVVTGGALKPGLKPSDETDLDEITLFGKLAILHGKVTARAFSITGNAEIAVFAGSLQVDSFNISQNVQGNFTVGPDTDSVKIKNLSIDTDGAANILNDSHVSVASLNGTGIVNIGKAKNSNETATLIVDEINDSSHINLYSGTLQTYSDQVFTTGTNSDA